MSQESGTGCVNPHDWPSGAKARFLAGSSGTAKAVPSRNLFVKISSVAEDSLLIVILSEAKDLLLECKGFKGQPWTAA